MVGIKKARRAEAKRKRGTYKTRDMQPAPSSYGTSPFVMTFVMTTGDGTVASKGSRR
jgi:hypothetical protein